MVRLLLATGPDVTPPVVLSDKDLKALLPDTCEKAKDFHSPRGAWGGGFTCSVRVWSLGDGPPRGGLGTRDLSESGDVSLGAIAPK